MNDSTQTKFFWENLRHKSLTAGISEHLYGYLLKINTKTKNRVISESTHFYCIPMYCVYSVIFIPLAAKKRNTFSFRKVKS